LNETTETPMEPEELPARWGVVRAEWMFHPDVGTDELAMLACLATYLDRQGFCWPSQQTLATRLKKSRPWVIKVLNNLVGLGLIERTRRERRDGGLRSCLYRMAPPDMGGAAATPDVPKTDGTQSNGQPSVSACPERDRGCHGSDRNHDQTIQESPSLQGAPEARREKAVPDFQKPARPQSLARPVPTGWAPSAEDLAWAAVAHPGIDAAALTETFRNASIAKGYRYLDFGCAWRGWFANQERWSRENHERRLTTRTPEHPRRDGRTGATRRDLHSERGGTNRGRAVPRQDGPQPGLAERNGAAADACLERLLARRAGHDAAGFHSG
jgi:cytochrome c553